MSKKSKNSATLTQSDLKSVKQTLIEFSSLLKEQTLDDVRLLAKIDTCLALLNRQELVISIHATHAELKQKLFDNDDANSQPITKFIKNTQALSIPIEYQYSDESQYTLLKIESRTHNEKNCWVVKKENQIDLEAFTQQVQDEKWVSKEYAQKLDFDLGSNSSSLIVNEHDEVLIPRWNYCLLQQPSTLLQSGLTIINMPSELNTSKPYTKTLKKKVHLSLFLFTLNEVKSEQLLCNIAETIEKLSPSSCIVGIYIDKEVDGYEVYKIRTQLETRLALSKKHFIILSDSDLITNSLYPLQNISTLLSGKIIDKQDYFIGNKVSVLINDLIQKSQELYTEREYGLSKKQDELQNLFNKNQSLSEHLCIQIADEKNSLELDIQKYQTLKSVFKRETHKLKGIIGAKQLIKLTALSNLKIQNCTTIEALHESMRRLFNHLNYSLDQASFQIEEVAQIGDDLLYQIAEHYQIKGLPKIPRLNLSHYHENIDHLEKKYKQLTKTKTLFFKEQKKIFKQFHETVCNYIHELFAQLFLEADSWSEELTLPLEHFIQEHHSLLRLRIESLKRIQTAKSTLEKRLHALSLKQNKLENGHQQIQQLIEKLRSLENHH